MNQIWQVRYGEDTSNTFIIVHPGDEEAVKRHFVLYAADVGYAALRSSSQDLTPNVHVKRLDVVTTGTQTRMARVHAAHNIK